MDKLIEALEALKPEEWSQVSECIKYDENVSELILSLRVVKALAARGEEDAN